MMRLHHHLRDRRRDDTGTTLVEFALVFPIAFLLICGIVGGCYLAFQNSSVHDGATAGARMASIETSLVSQSNPNSPNHNWYCESGLPISIEKAVAQASPLLKVNPAPLCSSSANPTQLTQGTPVVGDINITVTCGAGCASPTTTAVALALTTKGIVAPFGLHYNMSAISQVPVVSP